MRKMALQTDNILDHCSIEEVIKLARRKIKDGSVPEAISLCQDIIQRFPHNKKAKDLLKKLRSQHTSITIANQDPNPVELKSILALYEQGRLQSALEEVQKLQIAYSQSKILFDLCGGLAKELGHIDFSIKQYGELLKIDPQNAEAYFDLAAAVKLKGELPLAFNYYEKSKEINPLRAETHYNIGNVLRDMGDFENAIVSYGDAIKVKPDYAQAFNNMGMISDEMGDKDAAVKSYKQALKIKKDYYLAARNLVGAPRGSLDFEALELVKPLLYGEKRLALDKVVFKFFEANYIKHTDDLESVFEKFTSANKNKEEKIKSEIDLEISKNESCRRNFQNWIPARQKRNNSEIKKVFILGPSRCGKSSLERAIFSHKKVKPFFETNKLFRTGEKTPSLTAMARDKFQSLTFEDVFYRDEEWLIENDYTVITSTDPTLMYNVKEIHENIADSFFIVVNRDKIDLATEIFMTDYVNNNYYSYSPTSIMKFIDSYYASLAVVQERIPDRVLMVSLQEICEKPDEVIVKIGQLTSMDFELGADCSLPKVKLQRNQFRKYFEKLL